MAVSTSFILEDEELSCPICFEEYSSFDSEKSPKLLMCLHTFCLRCVQTLLKIDGSLQCSICRTDHKISQVKELFDNYVVCDYLRKQQLIEDEKFAMRLRDEYGGPPERNEQFIEDEQLALRLTNEYNVPVIDVENEVAEIMRRDNVVDSSPNLSSIPPVEERSATSSSYNSLVTDHSDEGSLENPPHISEEDLPPILFCNADDSCSDNQSTDEPDLDQNSQTDEYEEHLSQTFSLHSISQLDESSDEDQMESANPSVRVAASSPDLSDDASLTFEDDFVEVDYVSDNSSVEVNLASENSSTKNDSPRTTAEQTSFDDTINISAGEELDDDTINISAGEELDDDSGSIGSEVDLLQELEYLTDSSSEDEDLNHQPNEPSKSNVHPKTTIKFALLNDDCGMQ